mmetsp:Transcript_49469/g.111228  ORF Transcript_49469/g.111228 Transcript_49469/m.111228 type:complete len:301 (-) Transcript_49469:163-1065(-)
MRRDQNGVLARTSFLSVCLRCWNHRFFLLGCSRLATTDAFENTRWQRVVLHVNATHRDKRARSVRLRVKLDATAQPKRQDRQGHLCHELRHHDIGLRVDLESCHVCEGRLLEVNDDKMCAIPPARADLGRDVGRRCDPEAAAERDTKICFRSMIHRLLERCLWKCLPKVDRVFEQPASTARTHTVAASKVVSAPSRASALGVSIVLLPTVLALLNVPVPVQFRKRAAWEARAPVQSIGVLAHEILEEATPLQLDKRHVRRGRPSTECRLTTVSATPLVLARPHAVGASEVRDSCARRDAR